MGGGRSLPSGTVTFLFTDIEGSTESAAALGDERWAEVLQDHHRLLREALAAHSGVEVGREGDSFFVAFERAHDAVAAAAHGQRLIASHEWPEENELRVRMGIHTGEVLVRDGGYVGHEVHRAKRISDAAHGGQILLSQTTLDLGGAGLSFADLGRHRLKDLGEPQRLYQLVEDGLQREFPPLRSLDAFTHTLPLQRSAFVGREKEIAEIRELIETNRIATLTGVGGCGKTRLALQVAAEEVEHYSGGVFFVNLAPVSDPDAVVREIATSVGAPVSGVAGVAASGPVDEVLLSHLVTRECLIVLDNCEHLVDACAEIADRILQRCPDVAMLATSREALRVEGEQTWPVPSLTLPTEDGDAASSESVSLFKSRAQAVRAGFELTRENVGAVAEICRRLDGIPLAIEFAAARVSHLSPRQIAGRLDDRFKLLTGGQRRVQRQQTLQAALDWSFDLLDGDEKLLLRRLSVFAGDFGIEAAEGICADEDLPTDRVTDVLGSLVSKSLVDTELSEEEVRYRLLETVRAYCAERLTHAGEADRLRSSHRDWFLTWIESIPVEDRLFSIAQAVRIGREEPNLAAALDWSVAEDRPELVARLISRVRTLGGGQTLVRRRWIEFGLRAESELDIDVRLGLRIDAMMGSLTGAVGLPQTDFADDMLEGASPGMKAWALALRGVQSSIIAAFTRDKEVAAQTYRDLDEAERLTVGLRGEWSGYTLWIRSQAEMILGRAVDARHALEESIRKYEAAGNNDLAPISHFYLAPVAHVLGDHQRAAEAWGSYAAALHNFVGDEGLDAFPLGACSIFVALTARYEDPDLARAFLLRTRPRVLRSPVPRDAEDFVLACALLLTIEGEHVRGSTLLSWVRQQTLAAGRALPTGAHLLLYQHYRDTLRAALSPDEAKRSRVLGSQMSFEEASDLALGARVRA